MHKFILLSLLLLGFACQKREEPKPELPACIQSILKGNKLRESIKTVRVQKIGKEFHYWLNTDARHYDGVEYIVNSSCDTICSFCGECNPPKCSNKYDDEQKWQVIWNHK